MLDNFCLGHHIDGAFCTQVVVVYVLETSLLKCSSGIPTVDRAEGVPDVEPASSAEILEYVPLGDILPAAGEHLVPVFHLHRSALAAEDDLADLLVASHPVVVHHGHLRTYLIETSLYRVCVICGRELRRVRCCIVQQSNPLEAGLILTSLFVECVGRPGAVESPKG